MYQSLPLETTAQGLALPCDFRWSTRGCTTRPHTSRTSRDWCAGGGSSSRRRRSSSGRTPRRSTSTRCVNCDGLSLHMLTLPQPPCCAIQGCGVGHVCMSASAVCGSRRHRKSVLGSWLILNWTAQTHGEWPSGEKPPFRCAEGCSLASADSECSGRPRCEACHARRISGKLE